MEYGLIGEHLPHSFSPEIHRQIGNYRYELMELSPEEVGPFLEKKDFCGINVTIPYKQTVIPFLDEIDEAAKVIGAVNTIVNRGGKLFGYNTDFGGLLALFKKNGIDPSGKKAVILGSGGTSKTAGAVLGFLGAHPVLRTDINSAPGSITNEEALLFHSDAEILVNTTPMGMFPALSGAAADPADFPNLKGVIDVVYNPLRTDFIQKAEKLGIPCSGGLYMLVMQAILASELFFDKKIPPEKAEEIYRRILLQKTNIVLIGMPSSGKSTVGRILSEKLGISLFDSDRLIREKTGREIPEIFESEGEAFFRKIESETIRELSGKTGCIISTGGGVVLDPENMRFLSKNGRIFFLDRPLEKLVPTDDRPTASSREAIEKRFAERYSLYCGYADRIIKADFSPEEEARIITEDFLL